MNEFEHEVLRLLGNILKEIRGQAVDSQFVEEPAPKKQMQGIFEGLGEVTQGIFEGLGEEILDKLTITEQFIKQKGWVQREDWTKINTFLRGYCYEWESWVVRDAQGKPVLTKTGKEKKDGHWKLKEGS